MVNALVINRQRENLKSKKYRLNRARKLRSHINMVSRTSPTDRKCQPPETCQKQLPSLTSVKHPDETTAGSSSTSALAPFLPTFPMSWHRPDIRPARNFGASFRDARSPEVDSNRTAVVRALPQRRVDPYIHVGGQRDSAAWRVSRAPRNRVCMSGGYGSVDGDV